MRDEASEIIAFSIGLMGLCMHHSDQKEKQRIQKTSASRAESVSRLGFDLVLLIERELFAEEYILGD